MITENGKRIISKFLLGQAPSYASYIAVGCGPKPLTSNPTSEQITEYSAKDNLDFEMFRVPIVSRGYVAEDGVTSLVFTGELPTAERYEISEVGVFSAGSNPIAGAYDSKNLYSFSTTRENWVYNQNSTPISIPEHFEPLDGSDPTNIISVTDKVFYTNSNNRIFTNEDRVLRYEPARYLNTALALRGDTSVTSHSGAYAYAGNNIELTDISIDLSKNSPGDELRLAFSVINKTGVEDPEDLNSPDAVHLTVVFSSQDGTQTATMPIVIESTDEGVDFDANRYFVSTSRITDLVKTNGFTWSQVDRIKIYATVVDGGTPSSNFYILLDALRLENVSTTTPLYGMTGYTVIKTATGETFVKDANTTSYIEFRFELDVQ
jgi:hypothetical protein